VKTAPFLANFMMNIALCSRIKLFNIKLGESDDEEDSYDEEDA
jgi:hypothetical protein